MCVCVYHTALGDGGQPRLVLGPICCCAAFCLVFWGQGMHVIHSFWANPFSFLVGSASPFGLIYTWSPKKAVVVSSCQNALPKNRGPNTYYFTDVVDKLRVLCGQMGANESNDQKEQPYG